MAPASPVTSLSQLQPPGPASSLPLPGIETFSRDPGDSGYLQRPGPGDPGYLCPLLPWAPAPDPGPTHHAILGSLQPIKPELLREASELTSVKTEVRTPGPDITLASGPVTLSPVTSSGTRLGLSLARLSDTHLPQLPSSSTKSSEFWSSQVSIRIFGGIESRFDKMLLYFAGDYGAVCNYPIEQ